MIVQIVFAQNPINTDRPDQSDGTYVLPKKCFQLEEGIQIAKNSFQNNLMLRYGITKSTEARLLLDYAQMNVSKGIMPLGISLKQRILKQDNLIPAITFVGYIRPGKFASNNYKSSENPIDLKLAFQNDVTERISLSYNIGTSPTFNTMDCTFNFGYSPSEKISTFFEYFSIFEKDQRPSHNVDAGILYLITERLQLDVAIGSSILLMKENNFLTTGMSYRF